MECFGISFEHRRPGPEASTEYAEFIAFTAHCAAAGVDRWVQHVFFDTKWQGHNVHVDPSCEFTSAHAEIVRCANETLSQAEVFGAVVGKAYQGMEPT